MPKDTETINVSTESWNVAEGYTKLKILKQLVSCDRLETIAMFGTEELDQELEILPEMIIPRRINALDRLMDNLFQLFSNVKFAIKKIDLAKFEILRDRINLVKSVFDGISYYLIDDVSKQRTLKINEEFFNKLLYELRDIKESVNIPINDAGLIFRSSESLEFDELLKQLAEEG